MKTSRQIPMDHRVADGNGRMMFPWVRWSEEVGQAMQRLSVEMEASEPLASGATLAEVVTAYNELLAALKRIAP